ncbi:MAG: hypothetical protein ACO1N0_04890 [Fluviicola sp.]
MDQTEIILKVDIEDLRDIYFGKREHVYFFGPKTKTESIGLVCALVIFPLIVVYAIATESAGLGFVFSAIVFFTAVGTFWSTAGPIIQWKKSIDTFLEMAEKVKNLRVIYTDEFIHHIQDATETKLNWSVIEQATITDRFIQLQASTTIFLPKSSMTSQEYRILSDKIMERVQEVQKI